MKFDLTKKAVTEVLNGVQGILNASLETAIEKTFGKLKRELAQEIVDRMNIKIQNSADPKTRKAKEPIVVEVVGSYNDKEAAVLDIMKGSKIAALLVVSMKRHNRTITQESAETKCKDTLESLWGDLSAQEQKALYHFTTMSDFPTFAGVWQKWHDAVSKEV